MAITAGLFQSLVPITQFNRGQAPRTLDQLWTEKQLVMLKNDQPSAIILSPEEYERLAEVEENYLLLMEVSERPKKNEGKGSIPFVDVLSDLGIIRQELNETEDIDIEWFGVLHF